MTDFDLRRGMERFLADMSSPVMMDSLSWWAGGAVVVVGGVAAVLTCCLWIGYALHLWDEWRETREKAAEARLRLSE